MKKLYEWLEVRRESNNPSSQHHGVVTPGCPGGVSFHICSVFPGSNTYYCPQTPSLAVKFISKERVYEP